VYELPTVTGLRGWRGLRLGSGAATKFSVDCVDDVGRGPSPPPPSSDGAAKPPVATATAAAAATAATTAVQAAGSCGGSCCRCTSSKAFGWPLSAASIVVVRGETGRARNGENVRRVTVAWCPPAER